MKKNLIYSILFTGCLVLLTTLMYSCQKKQLAIETIAPGTATENDTVPMGILQEGVSSENGWLNFRDLHAFENTMAYIQKYFPVEQLEKWESNFKNYASWRSEQQRQENLENPETGQSIVNSTDIPDAHFASLLNKAGIIQIADTVYKFVPGVKEGKAFAIPSNYIKDVLAGKTDFNTLKGVIVHSISMFLLPFPKWEDNPESTTLTDICDFPGAFLFPWWGQKGGDIYHDDNGAEFSRDNGRRIRMDYHRWRVGYVFYSSIGVRVKLWKDTRFGGWMSNISMDKVNLSACSKGKIIIPGLVPTNYNETVQLFASNTNCLEKTLKWVAAPMHAEILPEHFNFQFTGVFRGQTASRNIRE